MHNESGSGVQLYSDDFEVFVEGDELYNSMLKRIYEAKHHVLLESYIFADDEIGKHFSSALIKCAQAGVIVRLHLDAAGSMFWSSRRLIDELQSHGIIVRWFHRWDWRHPWRYNRRNHRKLLVVDHYAYMGGFNIHRENSRSVYGNRRWRDTHLGFSGELACEARHLFGRFWTGRKRRQPPRPSGSGSILLSNFTRGGRRYLNGRFSDMLSHSRYSILMTTPYFVPNRRTQRLLCDAARRGVDVQLLVPRKNDMPLTQWAAHAAYDTLLANGVRIFEYLPRLLHSKTIVVDSNYASVGTANIDYRSFFLNYELNLFTRNVFLCKRLRSVFLEDLENSEEIQVEQWRRRFWGRKALEFAGWMARRWL